MVTGTAVDANEDRRYHESRERCSELVLDIGSLACEILLEGDVQLDLASPKGALLSDVCDQDGARALFIGRRSRRRQVDVDIVLRAGKVSLNVLYHLLGLEALPAQLQLAIGPLEEADGTIDVELDHVARLIDHSWCGPISSSKALQPLRTLDEPFCRLLRIVHVPLCQRWALNNQLPDGTERAQLVVIARTDDPERG